MLYRFATVTTLLSAILTITSAQAWGPEGHAIVADIAEAHLNPATQSAITALLAQEGHSHLDEISSWADQSPPKNPQNAVWHYVDIPLKAPQYDPNRDCQASACVVGKIVQYARELADPGTDAPSRLEALKWLVHFVGDIHQPLHAENNNDKGGNQVDLMYFGKDTNLHSIWDTAILEKALHLKLGPNFSFNHTQVKQTAQKLDLGISNKERKSWTTGGLLQSLDASIVAWAEESHTLAPIAYKSLPAVKKRRWEARYQSIAWPVARAQLQKAGLRLAEILNEALQ